jgi:hypothetical protein
MAGTVKRSKQTAHKRGANKNELAVKHRKEVHNFKQSKDIHEDRGTIQTKMSLKSNNVAGKRR